MRDRRNKMAGILNKCKLEKEKLLKVFVRKRTESKAVAIDKNAIDISGRICPEICSIKSKSDTIIIKKDNSARKWYAYIGTLLH